MIMTSNDERVERAAQAIETMFATWPIGEDIGPGGVPTLQDIARAALAAADSEPDDDPAYQLLANIEVADLPNGIVRVGRPDRGYIHIKIGDEAAAKEHADGQ